MCAQARGLVAQLSIEADRAADQGRDEHADARLPRSNLCGLAGEPAQNVHAVSSLVFLQHSPRTAEGESVTRMRVQVSAFIHDGGAACIAANLPGMFPR